MKRFYAIAALAMLCAATPAAAQDKAPCPADHVCASAPDTVMKAMEKAELEPKLDKDDTGDPMISSDVGSYRFDVFFYGCKDHVNCDSLRFESSFTPEPDLTIALANKWNAAHRFLQASVRDDGRMVFAMDIATIGGLTEANFADDIDWWNTMLDGVADFFEKEAPQKPGDKPAAKPADKGKPGGR